MVKVVVPSIIAKITNGEREVQVSASTLNEVLAQLVTRYGEPFKERIFDVSGKPKRFLNFYVNGRNVRFINDLDTPLKDTDEVTILPSASGG
jgi:molybdopterin synthase sulfur carrier subunit